MLRLGAIQYINALPFFLAFEEGELECPAERIYAVPSALNKMLREGALDLSPISAAEYLLHSNDYTLLPRFCIGAEGPVHSVALFSKHPLDQLSGKRVGLTTHSASSNLLTQVLCHHFWDVTPTFEPFNLDDPDLDLFDALVIIGDACLERVVEPPWQKVDLAQAWHSATGLPFTFAVFAARNAIAETQKPQINAILDSLSQALEWSQDHQKRLFELAEDRCPRSTVAYDDYYKALRFHFTQPQKKGLDLFGKLIHSLPKKACVT